RAVIHKPGPRLAISAMRTNAGRKTICQLGANLYQIIAAARMQRLTRKSISAVTTAAPGTMIRGKYTLPMRLAFSTTLSAAPDNAVEKKYQGIIPANTIRAYGV